MTVSWWFLLPVVAIGVWHPPLKAASDIEFQTLPFNEFCGNNFNFGEEYEDAPLPIRVDIPAIYVMTQVPQDIAVNWSTPSDVDRILKPDTPKQENGYFSVKISMSLGYDQKRDVFADLEHDGHDLAKLYRDQGLRDVSVTRYTAKGFPVLIVEATLDNGRKARMAYFATKIATNTILITYVHRHKWSDWDPVVWERFKQTLLGKVNPPKAGVFQSHAFTG